MVKILFSCLVTYFLLFPQPSQALSCHAGMILQKTPEKPEGDCVPFRDKKVRMDITQGTSKVGKSTETYLKPENDGNPHSVQSGYLQLWLDATDPLNDGYRPADGSTISRWKDKSGNGHDALQPTAAEQPIYTIRSINGLPSVEVTGTYLNLTPVPAYETARQKRDLSIAGGLLSKFKEQSTIFIVYTAAKESYGAFLQSSPRDPEMNFAVELIETAGNGIMTNWYYGNGGDFGVGDDSSGYTNSGVRVDGGTLDPTIVSLVQSYSETDMTKRYMNVYYRGWKVRSRNVSTAGNFDASTKLDIGAGFIHIGGTPPQLLSANLNAKIGEIIVYNKALTSSERQEIEQYLANKWNIKLSVKAASIKPVLLLDAQNNASINYSGTPAHEDQVGFWKDLSGYGNHAGAYELAKPFYIKGSVDPTRGINGFPALYFTGSHPGDKIHITGTSPAEFATHSMMTIWPKVMEKFSDSMTTFIIAKTPDGQGQSVLSTYKNLQISIPMNETYYTAGTLNVIWGIGGDSHTGTPFDASDYGVASLWAFRASPNLPADEITPSKRIFKNGVMKEPDYRMDYTKNINSPMQFNQNHPLRIAGPHYSMAKDPTWKGSIGEIRMYNRRLTDVEMCSCSKHLQNKWGIAPEPTACTAPSTCTAAGASTADCACP